MSWSNLYLCLYSVLLHSVHLLQCEDYVSFHKFGPEALQKKMGSYVVVLKKCCKTVVDFTEIDKF